MLAKKPFRVAVHVFTRHRDFSSRYVLSKLLEYYGCETFLTCLRNYINVTKYWRPHAFIHTTPGKMLHVANSCPYTDLFFCAGEGSEGQATAAEIKLAENQFIWDRTRRIYLWGPESHDKLRKILKERKGDEFSQSICDSDKLVVAGHPRIDISKFMPRPKNEHTKTIGLLGHFWALNLYDGRSALNVCFTNNEKLDEVDSQLRQLRLYNTLIDFIIDNTDYNISIRPYPLENPKQYKNTKYGKSFVYDKYNGRVEIDNSLDFSSWAAGQSVVVSSQTTALTDAYVMNIPVINTDFIAGNSDTIKKRGQIQDFLASVPFQPQTYDELFNAILNPNSIPINKNMMEEFWEKHYALNVNRSVLDMIAQDIVRSLNERHHNKIPLLPKKILELYDSISFHRAMRHDTTHANLNYKKNYHTIPSEYEEIIKTIIDNN